MTGLFHQLLLIDSVGRVRYAFLFTAAAKKRTVAATGGILRVTRGEKRESTMRDLSCVSTPCDAALSKKNYRLRRARDRRLTAGDDLRMTQGNRIRGTGTPQNG